MRLKVIKNCRCPECKENTAERIGILNDFNLVEEFKGCLCNHCGFKEKAKIIINQSQRKLL